MLQIADVATRLECDANGLWLSKSQAQVSHPELCQDWYRAVEDHSFWYRHRAECIVECMRQYPPGGPVVDVGGGSGHVSLALQRAGFEPVLLEPSLQAALQAQSRGIAPVICSTLQDAGFKDQSLAAVGVFDVLEHVEDDAGFLATIHRLLQPSGRLYLTVPAFRFLWSAYDEFVGHHERYTLDALKRLLGVAGFDVERATYLFCLLPLPIALLRSLPARLGVKRCGGFERFEQEYAPRRSLSVRVLEWLLEIERRRLRRQGNIPFGSSCLVVARAR